MEESMKVKLISYSQLAIDPALKDVYEHKLYDIQNLIAYCARVSNPSNQSNTETTDRLLRYLIENKHWSPFEMVSACIEIETTRDIARQLLRHRSFSFQEFSQRYADPVKELSFAVREARLQDKSNRQNSIKIGATLGEMNLIEQWNDKQIQVLAAAKEAYKWAIDNGIAKEQARAVLPEGMTMSRLYVNGTLRSWITYIELRSGNGTQLEHLELAKACAVVISKVFPMIKRFVQDE